MAIYLIDYENTGVKGLAGIERLKEEDQIILFYGPKTGAIPFDEHVKLSQSASHVEYIKTTKTAKNYLDFQLTTYLGYLIASTPVREYHVISKDSGYDSVIDFWSKKGLVIKRQDTLAGKQQSAGQEKNASVTAQKRKKEKTHNRNTENQKPGQLQPQPASQQQLQQQPEVQILPAVQIQPQPAAESDIPAKRKSVPVPDARASMQTDADVLSAEKDKSTQAGQPESAQPAVPKSVPESVRKKIRAVLKTENLQGGVYKQIYACMLASYDKQSFNTALVRAFTQEKGNHYYKSILQIFQEWIQKG